MFAVANTKSHAIRYHLPCLVSLKMRITNPAVIETAFNQYLENEGPIDDEPLNEYVYNMHILW